MVGQNIVKWG